MISDIDHSLPVSYLNNFFEEGTLVFRPILLRLFGYFVIELLP